MNYEINDSLEELRKRMHEHGVLLDSPRDDAERQVVGVYEEFENTLRNGESDEGHIQMLRAEVLAMAINYQQLTHHADIILLNVQPETGEPK